ncbi:MAG TPA: sigma-70 family RNA polymerase sigma factor [Thermoanaerobaculia bacterium]
MNGDQHIDVAAAWHELGERLRIYVARRVNPGDADDVVQSVMVKLLEHRHEIAAESIRAWLFTVTRNAVVEHYRKQRPAIDLDSSGDVPDLDATDPADRAMGRLSDCIDPMLRLLPQPDADLLRRVDLEGEAQTALAAQLQIPLSTLKSRVQRARTKLRSAFDQCCSIALSRSGAPIDVERVGECSPSCGSGDTRSSCS